MDISKSDVYRILDVLEMNFSRLMPKHQTMITDILTRYNI